MAIHSFDKIVVKKKIIKWLIETHINLITS